MRENTLLQRGRQQMEALSAQLQSPHSKVFESISQDALTEAASQAESDGQKGIPRYDDASCQYEEKVTARFRQFFAAYTGPIHPVMAQLEMRAQTLQQQLSQSVAGMHWNAVKALEKQYEDAKVLFNRPLGETDAIPALLRRPVAVAVILVIISLLEVPLNVKLFEVLGFAPVHAIVPAAALSAMMVLLMHVLGKKIKQRQEGVSGHWALFLGSFGVLLILVLSYCRAAATMASGAAVEDPLEMVSTFDVMHGLQWSDVLANPQFPVTLALLSAIGLGSAVLSFVSHDSSSAFEKAWFGYHVEREEQQRKFVEAKEREARLTRVLTPNSKPPMQQDQEELAEILEINSTLSRYIDQAALELDQRCKQVIYTYRNVNQQHRPPGDLPLYWSYAMPEVLIKSPLTLS